MTITRIAADIGGTFTDIAALTDDGRLVTRKIPSTPGSYGDAVIEGVRGLVSGLGGDVGDLEEILHGCTVATNAILEHRGARTALVTTKGFRDVLELRRVRVPTLYDPLYEKPAPLVPRHLRFEVDERLDARGQVLRPVDEADVMAAIERMKALDVEAVAVCLLHSYANPDHERRIGAIIAAAMPGVYLSLSVDVLPQKREYERTSTTVINSYVGPPVKSYLDGMIASLASEGIGGRLMVMQSSGGMLDADSVLARPANIVECGPAAGVIGAQHMSEMFGLGDLITLDMGGTTAKASIVEKGKAIQADEYEVGSEMSANSPLVGGGGYVLKLPAIDISEVGAGGGSLAWLDRAGSLKVGPRSAGAVPGPACYGAGNEEPTVTDANVVLGYVNPESLARGTVPIDATLARRAIHDRIARPMGRDLLHCAFGIHGVANANMMRAVKAVTTYRGRDPRDFSLMAFGGNGGIHGMALAAVLQIRRVILPPAAGVFSAVGLLFSDIETSETAPFNHLASGVDPALAEAIFARLEARVAAIVGDGRDEIALTRIADARFLGQAFEIPTPLPDGTVTKQAIAETCRRFAAEHAARYGHDFGGQFPVEFVNLRARGARRPRRGDPVPDRRTQPRGTADRQVYFGPAVGMLTAPVITREMLSDLAERGPFVIEEYEGTAIVPPDWTARRDAIGNVIVEAS